MTERPMPRYPIYVPSKGRAKKCLTAQFLIRDGVPFRLVVERQERDAYVERFGAERVLVLPWETPAGTVVAARNWIKGHATEEGHARHWQLDDNISGIWRLFRGRRLYCASGAALAATEDFVDRYENIAIGGLNYVMFGVGATKPFVTNCHVYSCCLILNSLPYGWRGRYNEDTDLCLRVLADGWCTVLFNAFLVQKLGTMTMKGGNTDVLNYHNDGRLKMARALERLWPGVVTTKRRFRRPQHVVKDSWQRFDTPLRLKPGIVIPDGPNEYGLRLKQVKAEVRSEDLRGLLRDTCRDATVPHTARSGPRTGRRRAGKAKA